MQKDKPVELTDAQLIKRIQARDSAAFDLLFERHRRGIFAYVRGMVNDAGVAEDLVQEVFIRLVRDIEKIRPERGASPWLYRVARNLAIDTIRHRRFEVLPGDDALDRKVEKQALGERRPDEDLIEKELRGDVRALVRELPEDERELVVLRFFAGLTFREIAETVDRPLGTVLWQVRESLKKLKKKWGKTGMRGET